MQAPQISVVVPCYDEAEVIDRFHAALMAVLVRLRLAFEICYVDDGSGDATRVRLSRLAHTDERVRYTCFTRNFGKEAAMLAGLRMARGDVVVLMDADLQHPPELIPRMVELHRLGYDQVVAQRDRTGEGVLRTAVSRAYYRTVRRCMDVEVVDGAGDFRLLSRQAVDSVLSLPEANRFSKGLFSWIGFDTVNFAYQNVERAAGTSKWGGRRLLNYGIDGLLSFNSRPLRLAIYTGLCLFLSALAYALWIIVSVALYGVKAPGYTTLLAAVVALSGIQLATLGVIGEYVGRIYHEAKRRPHYVVRETDESRARRPVRALPPTAGPPVAGSPPAGSPVAGTLTVGTPVAGTLPADAPGAFEPKVARLASNRPRLDPKWSRTARQFAAFCAIGLANTAVYLAVYASLNVWIPYLVAHVVGYAISLVGSFLLNSYVTCRTRPTWRAFARYPLSGAVNVVASGILLYAAVSGLGLDKNLSALVAGVLVTPLTFLLARWAIVSGTAGTPPRRAPVGGVLERPVEETDSV
jgi:glycosyltransferase involved in cell wall biosynthesis/putative flippase GtrA